MLIFFTLISSEWQGTTPAGCIPPVVCDGSQGGWQRGARPMPHSLIDGMLSLKIQLILLKFEAQKEIFKFLSI